MQTSTVKIKVQRGGLTRLPIEQNAHMSKPKVQIRSRMLVVHICLGPWN